MRSTETRPSRPTRRATGASGSPCGSRRCSTPGRRTVRRSTCTSLAGLALACLLAACGTSPRAVPFTDLTQRAGDLEFTRITVSHAETRDELQKTIERNNPGRKIELPPIDFAHKTAFLVAAGPRSSTGYELHVVRVEDTGSAVLVVVREQTPSLGDPVAARVTYPFLLLALPRSDKPVKLKWLGRP